MDRVRTPGAVGLAPGARTANIQYGATEPVIVDAHQHFWNLEREQLPWMRDEHDLIRRTFLPADLEPLLAPSGVSRTVLVQAACSDSDTEFLFECASRHDWVGGVIAWLDLRSPGRAGRRLEELAERPKLRGFRHLIHDEQDPHWILRDPVLESLALLEQHALILELPCVFPRHLGDVPELASVFPAMTIVIDHLAKPPLRRDEMARWETALRAAASHENVAAKISGLNTTLGPDWSAEHLREAIEVAVDAFGPDRLVCGSDWPVALLNGDYAKVWRETTRAIENVAPQHAEQLLTQTALRLYDLAGTTAHPPGGPS